MESLLSGFIVDADCSVAIILNHWFIHGATWHFDFTYSRKTRRNWISLHLLWLFGKLPVTWPPVVGRGMLCSDTCRNCDWCSVVDFEWPIEFFLLAYNCECKRTLLLPKIFQNPIGFAQIQNLFHEGIWCNGKTIFFQNGKSSFIYIHLPNKSLMIIQYELYIFNNNQNEITSTKW